MDTAVFVPPDRRVRISGKEYTVVKLTLRQTIQLAAWCAAFGQDTMAKLQSAVGEGKPDMLALADAVGEVEMAKLLQVLLGAPSLEDRERLAKATLEDLSELAAAFTEVNDLAKIAANFQKADENLGGLLRTLGRPARPSSPESQQRLDTR